MQPITGARAACPQPPHESGTRSLRSSADGQRTPMCRSACSTRCDVAGCYGCNELPWLWLEKPVPIHCIRVHPCSIQVVPTLMSQASGLTLQFTGAVRRPVQRVVSTPRSAGRSHRGSQSTPTENPPRLRPPGLDAPPTLTDHRLPTFLNCREGCLGSRCKSWKFLSARSGTVSGKF